MMSSKNYLVSRLARPRNSDDEDRLSPLRAWTTAQYASFRNTGNVLHDTFFPPSTTNPTPSQIARTASRHLRNWESADRQGSVEFLHVLDPETGETVAGAQWSYFPDGLDRPGPETVPLAFLTEDPDDVPAGSTLEREREFARLVMNEFHGRRKRDMEGPHALLGFLFVRPGFERQGIGRMMARYGIERAEMEGLPCLVESSPRGRRMYEKEGFTVREEVRLRFKDGQGQDRFPEKGDVVWYFMERPAPNADGAAS